MNMTYLFFAAESTNHTISIFHLVIHLFSVVAEITRIRFAAAWKSGNISHNGYIIMFQLQQMYYINIGYYSVWGFFPNLALQEN